MYLCVSVCGTSVFLSPFVCHCIQHGLVLESGLGNGGKKKGQSHRHCTENLGSSALRLLTSVQQPEDLALLLSTGGGVSYSPWEVSVGEWSQAVSIQEEEAAVNAFCTSLSTFTHGTEEGFANCVSLTWERFSSSHAFETIGSVSIMQHPPRASSAPHSLCMNMCVCMVCVSVYI